VWQVDVLFIDLNSNAYNASGQAGTDADQAHIGFITDVVQRHGAEAKYTVVIFHHSIYSPAAHANDTDNKKRRVDFPAALSNLGVDLVLQGHDHSYSRSYVIDRREAESCRAAGCHSRVPGPGWRHLRHRELRVRLEVLALSV
jgi:3',5'-cyclic AMP phosphodiesterase CpdA